MVLATQNPIEYEGTFPLPEAQLDRFLLRVSLGYPTLWDEIDVLNRQQFHHPIEDLEPVVTVEELLEAQEAIKQVHVATPIKEYLARMVRKTRENPDVYLGASPRGSLTLYRMGQARAAVQGRDFVLPDDIKAIAVPALAHRVILAPGARLREQTPEAVVTAILKETPVPEAKEDLQKGD
jgi:MoxR-like ATPase